MATLLKKVKIYQPNSPNHLKVKDVLVNDNGIIVGVEDNIEYKIGENDSLLENLSISSGWVDALAHWGEPGLEHNETLATGAQSAAAGGFTHVGLIPNTTPTIDNAATLFSLSGKQHKLPVTILPIAAVTQNCEGKQFTEMYDLCNNGAYAFSDGLKSIQNSGIMMKALQYLKAINKPLIQIPQNTALHPEGLINEGIISTQLGLPGQSKYAETLMVHRDIALAEYTKGRLHIAGVSCAESIELIKEAKIKGLNITCSTSPAYLHFTDADLITYNTNLKLFPPLRTNTDKQALLNAINDKTIDCVFSHHLPIHNDDKDCEFEQAKQGMLGHQTCFVASVLSGISVERWVEMQEKAQNIFDINNKIEVGNVACITLFKENTEYIFTKAQNKSKSNNSNFFDYKFNNKVVGIFHKNTLILNDEF